MYKVGESVSLHEAAMDIFIHDLKGINTRLSEYMIGDDYLFITMTIHSVILNRQRGFVKEKEVTYCLKVDFEIEGEDEKEEFDTLYYCVDSESVFILEEDEDLIFEGSDNEEE